MVGRFFAYCIPSSNIQLVPEEPAIGTQTRDIEVKVEVDCFRALNDIEKVVCTVLTAQSRFCSWLRSTSWVSSALMNLVVLPRQS